MVSSAEEIEGGLSVIRDSEAATLQNFCEVMSVIKPILPNIPCQNKPRDNKGTTINVRQRQHTRLKDGNKNTKLNQHNDRINEDRITRF